MKNCAFFYLLFLVFCTACHEGGSNEHIANDSLSADSSITNDRYTRKFRNLIKNEDGFFRGVSFGMSREEVISQEDTLKKADNNEGDTLDYLINYNFPETAEVIYYLGKGKKVNRIQVDIYPEGLDSQKEIFMDFRNYFDSKYGKPVTETENEIIWNSTVNNLKVSLKKQGNQKVHDLQIDFIELNSAEKSSSSM
ncbi:MAG TPA: hypothetical protein VNW99_03230 [Cytophagaceae bacterium]|jgi:hypothetical protein|nr:hypothetical protein [Cytophagaceae bacterium]